MRRTTPVVAAVLLLCIGAAPTSQPETKPSYPALQKALAKLTVENATLKKTVEQLTTANAALQKQVDALKADQAVAAAKSTGEPKIGMTEAEALGCFDQRYYKIEISRETTYAKDMWVYFYSGDSSLPKVPLLKDGKPNQPALSYAHQKDWGFIVISKPEGKVVEIQR